MIKIVTFFLIGIAILAIFGRLRMPRIGKTLSNRKCPRCGRYLIGRARCPCKSAGG